MRSIWKGHISFGLVHVPVSIYPAEERSDLQLHMIDSRNFARVRYERVNEETGQEVPWNEIVKGYEYDDGKYVVLQKEELEKAAPRATQTVEIESFVDLAAIDPLQFDKPYYLEPQKSGEKGYALLREVLRETDKAGIARVVIRTRQYIAAMVPRDEALVLHLLRYAQELRSTEGLKLPPLAAKLGVSKKEIDMARNLVESMTEKWRPESFKDEYRVALLAWIKKRIKAGQIRRAPELPELEEPEKTINIMDALKKSLAKSGAAKKRPKTRAKKRSTHKHKKAG